MIVEEQPIFFSQATPPRTLRVSQKRLTRAVCCPLHNELKKIKIEKKSIENLPTDKNYIRYNLEKSV
jgi:hypothetical protein